MSKTIIAIIIVIIIVGLGYWVYQSTITPEELSEKEQACINSGGKISTSLCCKTTGDFPNTCLVGPCTCAPENSHKVKICDCGPDKCFDGEKCILLEESSADSAVVAFMKARIQRDQEFALSWLTDNAKQQYAQPGLTLIGTSNPHFADFEILEREKLNDSQFRFKVRIYEEYTGQGRVGYFDETLTVIKRERNKHLIDSVERSEYTNL